MFFKKIKRDFLVIKLIVTSALNHIFLKLFLLICLGFGVASFDGVGLSLLIPILQKIVNGKEYTVSIPYFKHMGITEWLNSLGNIQQVLVVSCVIILAFSFRGVMEWTRAIVSAGFSLRIGNYWKEKIFKAIVESSLDKLYRYKFGYLQNLVTLECEHLRSVFIGALLLFSSTITISAYMTFLAIISYKLLIITFFLVALGMGPILAIVRKIQKSGYDRVKTRSELASQLLETLSSIKIIHLMRTSKLEMNKFKKATDNYARCELSMYKKKDMTGPINQVLGATIACAIILCGLMIDGIIEPIKLVLFVGIFTRMSTMIQVFNSSISAIGKVYSSIFVVHDFHNELCTYKEISGDKLVDHAPEYIEFKDIQFGYTQETTVLDDISLKVNKGTHVAFLGSSGSGKSTLSNLILKLNTPWKGDIITDQFNLSEVENNSWRGLFGVVEQLPMLFNGTIRENIIYGNEKNVTAEEIKRAVSLSHADAFINGFPDGLETMVGTMGNSLSGGQKQRIALARALLKNPDIIILDEATSSVDIESEKLINETIRALKKSDKTIISITHKLSILEMVDYVYFISDGKIVYEGIPSKFQKEEIYELYK